MLGLGNFSPSEGSVTSTVTVTFPWKARRIVITNDSASRDLQFKYQSGQDFATLKPTETVSSYIRSSTVLLSAPSSAATQYRVWGYG